MEEGGEQTGWGCRLGGGAEWVTPIATYDSRAEAETAYGICHRRAVPYYSLLGQFSALTKLTLQARRDKKTTTTTVQFLSLEPRLKCEEHGRDKVSRLFL